TLEVRYKGLNVADVNFVAAGAGDTFIAAMKQGKIDVGITTQPTVARMQKTGDGVLLVDLSKIDTTRAALGGDYPFISVFARADYIAKNKDTTQRVVNAYVKTLKWIATHSPLEIAEKLPADYYGGDKDSYVQALKDSMGMFSPDGKMTKGAPEFELGLLKQFNENVQKSPNVDLSKTYTDFMVSGLETPLSVFLVAAYHVLVGRAGLGVVNLFPVLVSVAAIGATMRFAGVPFNAFTATLLAITIGIGIDYSVHITHRFVDEFEERGRGVVESLDRTVSGTGGALTGSVLTTATGIGVLVISPFPAIGQFGLLTALSVVYAYLAAMFLLPAALVCWAWLVRGERPATGVLVYK
ncbi:MAG: MMPL family transporter, partial [Natronomonas sp.]